MPGDSCMKLSDVRPKEYGWLCYVYGAASGTTRELLGCENESRALIWCSSDVADRL